MDSKNIVSKKIDTLKDKCKLYSEYLGHSIFSKPVTQDDLKFWEQENETVLPDSLKDFLLVSNGLTVDDQLIKIFPIQRMKGYEQPYASVPEDLVVIGTVLGDDEKVYFSRKTGKFMMDEQGSIQNYESMAEILDWVIQMLSYSC